MPVSSASWSTVCKEKSVDRAAIDQAALGEAQRERALGLVLNPVQEGRVLDAHDGAVGALDLHGEGVGLGEGRVNIGGMAHRLFHIVGLERPRCAP